MSEENDIIQNVASSIQKINFEEEIFLSECWTLYFHDPDDNQWTPSSYKIIGHFSTLQDWCYTDVSFTNLWQKGMFFIMREHIQPLWEDPLNKEGGCFSFKVNKPDAGHFWFKLGSLLLGSTLGKTPIIDSKICGISMSPKRNYCILRVWVQSHEYNNIDLYNLDTPSYSQIMYKSHNENSDFDGKDTTTTTTTATTNIADKERESDKSREKERKDYSKERSRIPYRRT
jgi:hypothetical protein